MADGKIIYSITDKTESFKFTTGRNQVFPGLESLVITMKQGECSKITINSDIFLESNNTNGLIPKDTEIIIEATLLEIENENITRWDLDEKERKIIACGLKNDGNEQFKKKLFSDAVVSYAEAIKHIENDNGSEIDELKFSLYLNSVLMNLKLKEFFPAVEAANKALEINPKSSKGLYRRGLSLCGLGEYEKALKDLHEAFTLEPENKEIENEITRVKEEMKKQKEKDKKVYAKMFGNA